MHTFVNGYQTAFAVFFSSYKASAEPTGVATSGKIQSCLVDIEGE